MIGCRFAAGFVVCHNPTMTGRPLDGTLEPAPSKPRYVPTTGKVEFVVVVAAYAAYTTLRILVEGSRERAIENAETVLRVERALGLDWELSAQEWTLARPTLTGFWNFAYEWVYWPSVAIALVLLWNTDRRRYVLLRNTVLISATMGLFFFGLFPVSPPRFLDGYVDTLAEYGDRLVAERSQFVNEYAAVPSFHVGWPAVAGVIVAWSMGRAWVWALALTPALLLAPAVVFTGNHFVIDILIGLAVCFAALAIACLISAPQSKSTE